MPPKKPWEISKGLNTVVLWNKASKSEYMWIVKVSSKSGFSLKKKKGKEKRRVFASSRPAKRYEQNIKIMGEISNGELATGIEPMSPEIFHIGQNPMWSREDVSLLNCYVFVGNLQPLH